MIQNLKGSGESFPSCVRANPYSDVDGYALLLTYNKHPEEMHCQGDLDIISDTLHAAGITVEVDIAMACQSDSECREILGVFDDDNERNIMKN